MAEFPITMTNLRPVMTAKINDTDEKFLVDSGAFYSILSPASVAELKLPTSPTAFGFYITGIGGGKADASIAKVKTFTLANVPIPNVLFLVGGSDIGGGTVGVLGQNVLHLGDVEYDLAQGAVRLMKVHDCSKAMLAYWVGPTQPYSIIDIGATSPQKPFTTGSAFINGHEIRVLFDTGAGLSVLSLKAAARVGIKPDSPGVVSAGRTWGFGSNTIPSYIAPFSSFKIGDEEVRNTKLRIADIDLEDADMLIGPDFFLSHRIYVSNSQHKLYFTYNGGPVFNLSGAKYPTAAAMPTASTEHAPTDNTGAVVPASEASPGDTKTAAADGEDAADYSRRGNALASRRDFAQALTNLTRACELAPDNAGYFYQRGMVYWQMKQGAEAMSDFDAALRLKPNDVAVLVSRAELLLEERNDPLAGADLDAADAVASKQADIRFQMGHLYLGAELPAAAIAQFNLWITWHTDDARMPEALNSRCLARALTGEDLGLALKDCNTALKRADKSSSLFARISGTRGFVLMRMGDYDKSMLDYGAALKIIPKNPWYWYGLGIDKLRKQKNSEGEADIAQAKAIWPQVVDEFNRHGISP